ncbi:MAG: hypothetical protein F4Z71_11885 [Gammaproteobacteria bacterium]|nr:hypothetical protein [Gammaproteobacteria bacterium]MYE30063.1 hypothetical protein [Gammaproteobacteria bacterium]
MSTQELVIQSDFSIDDYSHGFMPAICQLIGAIATHDGVVTAEEYQAVVVVNKRLVSIVDSPLLINTLTLRSLMEPPSFNEAIKQVRKSAKDQDSELKHYVYQSLQPLLSLQRADQGKTSQSILKALDIEKSAPLSELAESFRSGLKGVLGRRTSYDRIRDFALVFDDKQLLEALEESGQDVNGERLQRALMVSKANAIESCRELENRNHELDLLEIANQQLSSMAETMIEQTRKRLHVIQRRADKQKNHFEEDINAMLDDTQVELEKTWKDRVARAARNKQAALHKSRDDEAVLILSQRIDKVRNRYDSVMSDWGVEYESFCNELADSRKIFSFSMNRREFTELIPSASIQSRLMSSLDSVTATILKTGSVAGVATVAIAGVMGVGTAAGLLMTPVGLGVSAGVALSGIYKFFSNPQERILREAEAKADETVRNLGKLCEDAISEHAAAMDELVGQFYRTAESIYSPIAKEVAISTMCCEYQRMVIAEISKNTERYVENMLEN